MSALGEIPRQVRETRERVAEAERSLRESLRLLEGALTAAWDMNGALEDELNRLTVVLDVLRAHFRAEDWRDMKARILEGVFDDVCRLLLRARDALETIMMALEDIIDARSLEEAREIAKEAAESASHLRFDLLDVIDDLGVEVCGEVEPDWEGEA